MRGGSRITLHFKFVDVALNFSITCCYLDVRSWLVKLSSFFCFSQRLPKLHGEGKVFTQLDKRTREYRKQEWVSMCSVGWRVGGSEGGGGT